MYGDKTLGPTGSRLIASMSQREPPVFTLAEARTLLGSSSQVTSNLLTRLVRQGWIVRIRTGVYEVAPIWASPGSYVADRFSRLAHSLASPYYVGYRSALEIYGWLQHPVVGHLWVAVPAKRRKLRSPRDQVVWVVTKAGRFEWGTQAYWVDSARIIVSDPERTFVDCLHLSRHAGGITEITGSLVRAWPTLDRTRLRAHLDRMGLASVSRRLGAILESIDVPGGDDVLEGLPPGAWRGRPLSLDPNLPADGEVNRRWGVRMNVPSDELAMAGRT